MFACLQALPALMARAAQTLEEWEMAEGAAFEYDGQPYLVRHF